MFEKNVMGISDSIWKIKNEPAFRYDWITATVNDLVFTIAHSTSIQLGIHGILFRTAYFQLQQQK